LLVGLMMIIAKYGKKKLRFDPATAIGKGWNHLISKLTSEPD
jgi:hypothetical protein